LFQLFIRFGEIAVFKWTRRTATCIASATSKEDGRPTEVLSLSSKTFTELSTEQPWLQLAMADLCHQRTGDMLSCISFFSKVPKVKLELLGSLFSYRSVKANTVICYEGDDAHEFYILMQGQVKIKASDDDSSSDSPQKMKELATVDSISWCVLDFFEIFLSFCAHI
jgi:CRP-like cAMP-binding protein